MSSQSRSFVASPEGLKRLQAAKAERGWTFAAIAERAGVSADTVSRLFHRSWRKQVSGESPAPLISQRVLLRLLLEFLLYPASYRKQRLWQRQ
ncbi:helix-turn-helix domain-containing protein [Nodosilinea sp. LEGE 07088]|uniref:helix-turn-helix domain-containing protein n=1 Tax=Nodosilinea sp. LEGE 07088 TaxID=2777968 RepID=UPI00187EEC7B|nr:helix-turn-helix domain-containing protein [Nodosilinea sp. LEGE 07088]